MVSGKLSKLGPRTRTMFCLWDSVSAGTQSTTTPRGALRSTKRRRSKKYTKLSLTRASRTMLRVHLLCTQNTAVFWEASTGSSQERSSSQRIASADVHLLLQPPTIGDVRAINKLVRSVRAEVVKLCFWPLKGPVRVLGCPDVPYRNNSDKSSQRGQCVFLCEQSVGGHKFTRGSLVDYESQNIHRTVLSTTVAELYSVMKCSGTCQFVRGLWMDISGEVAPLHLRTDANNLVTTASTTHLPEQKETIHIIQMLRKET